MVRYSVKNTNRKKNISLHNSLDRHLITHTYRVQNAEEERLYQFFFDKAKVILWSKHDILVSLKLLLEWKYPIILQSWLKLSTLFFCDHQTFVMNAENKKKTIILWSCKKQSMSNHCVCPLWFSILITMDHHGTNIAQKKPKTHTQAMAKKTHTALTFSWTKQ